MDALFHERFSGWRFFVSVGWCLGPASVLGINLESERCLWRWIGWIGVILSARSSISESARLHIEAFVHGLRE